MSQRTKYTEEFKQQILDLYKSGTTVRELAREYGLVEQTIYKWKKLYMPVAEDAQGNSINAKDYAAMQKEIARLKMENEILKKATAIFARKQ